MRGWQKMTGVWALVLLLGTGARAAGPGDKVPAKAPVGQGIKFTDAAWGEVVKKARAENKIIFLDAYASWCGPCKLLQKNVFTRADVGEVFNENFINVKVDMERGEGPQLSRMFPLEVYPTLFFIEPSGKIVRKVAGYRSAEQLILLGKTVADTM